MPKYNSRRPPRNVQNGIAIVAEGAPGGMRKIRDPLGHQLAVPQKDKQGNSVYVAPDGRTFVSKPLK